MAGHKPLSTLTCPHCDGKNVSLVDHPSLSSRFDWYRCDDCGRMFSRPVSSVRVQPDFKKSN